LQSMYQEWQQCPWWFAANAQCTPEMYLGSDFWKSGQIFEIWPGGYIFDPPPMSNIPPS
jgi:hypothetical protein